MWNYKTPGIPDDAFERSENVPITKEEVRVIQISKARLCPGYTVYDIGSGSGSISIEAAIQVESGKVIAIDYDTNAIELTKKNIEKFGLTNISVILGNAKEKILDLEPADAIFIGGTGGDTEEIVKLCQNKLNLEEESLLELSYLKLYTLYYKLLRNYNLTRWILPKLQSLKVERPQTVL